MVLFYLTNCALDVSMGVLWWVTKNTTIGLYNGVYYIKDTLYNDAEKTIEDNIDNIENIDNIDNNDLEKDIVIITNKDHLEEIISLKQEIEKLKMYQKKFD